MTISRWANTQCIAEISCPRCGADVGKDCTTPKRRRIFQPHGERTKAYIEKIGMEEFKRRHSVQGRLQNED